MFLARRKALVEPILGELLEWLQRKREEVPPKILLGIAVGYMIGEWPKLIRYLGHPDLTPDNNATERAVRPFVCGRKAWLYSGSPAGAYASAAIYSLIETAKLNNLEPYRYLWYLFEKLPHARGEDDYRSLLPQYLDRAAYASFS